MIVSGNKAVTVIILEPGESETLLYELRKVERRPPSARLISEIIKELNRIKKHYNIMNPGLIE